MTTEEIVSYYSNLLIVQYHEQPKAVAHIQTLVRPVIMDQLPGLVQNGFDINLSAGMQLDVLGKYIGVNRHVYTPSGPVTLTDNDYRTLLKLVLIKNNSGSSLFAIQALLAQNFPNLIKISDTGSMNLNYTISQQVGTPDLLAVLISGIYLPKPMGVGSVVVTVPSFTANYFGFRTYASAGSGISPFNLYGFYNETYTWFSYAF